MAAGSTDHAWELKKGETAMVDMDEASWIKANVEVVKNYLTKEFENFAIAHQAEQSLQHTFTVDNGKKRFKLVIKWATLADRNFASTRINRLVTENVAQDMRLHGENSYHWTPSG
jgi:hypothetical protein